MKNYYIFKNEFIFADSATNDSKLANRIYPQIPQKSASYPQNYPQGEVARLQSCRLQSCGSGR